MATNTGNSRRIGAVTNRYQTPNLTGTYDKYDGKGNYLATKVTPGRYKGIELREAAKAPRTSKKYTI
ncbi:MAG: hypothetical protein FWG25_06715 [Promicromonosporaceae bacterium]|nr:hypothetical protein [Promicromonosporaceae bacterium]